MLIISILMVEIISYFVAVFFHEMGHWLFGAFYDYEFKQIFLGPFIFKKINGEIKIHFNRHLSLWPGAIELQIKKVEQLSAKGYIMMLLGGPITSFSLSIIAFIVAIYTRNLVLICLCGMFLGTGLGSVYPFKRRLGLHYSDGKRALEIIKNNEHGNNEYNMLFVSQCDIHNLSKEKEQEIATKLLYMLNHPVDKDIVYLTYALTWIQENKLNILEEIGISQQLNDIHKSATRNEQKIIQIIRKDITEK